MHPPIHGLAVMGGWDSVYVFQRQHQFSAAPAVRMAARVSRQDCHPLPTPENGTFVCSRIYILKRHLNSPAAAPSREDVQVFTAAGWVAKHEQTIEYCMKPVEISLNSSQKPATPIADHKYTAPEAHSATTRYHDWGGGRKGDKDRCLRTFPFNAFQRFARFFSRKVEVKIRTAGLPACHRQRPSSQQAMKIMTSHRVHQRYRGGTTFPARLVDQRRCGRRKVSLFKAFFVYSTHTHTHTHVHTERKYSTTFAACI